MAKNYVYKTSGGSATATRYAPQFKEYNGFGHYFDGKQWYSDVSVFSDDFNTDTSSNYTAADSAIVSVIGGKLQVENGATAYGKGVLTVNLTGKHRIVFNGYTGSDTTGYTIRIGTTSGGAELYTLLYSDDGLKSEDIILTGTNYISFGHRASTSGMIVEFDNIAIIPLNDDGSIDVSGATPLATPITYLPYEINVDSSGNVTSVDSYEIPTLVEDCIKADTVKTSKLDYTPVVYSGRLSANATAVGDVLVWNDVATNKTSHNAGQVTIEESGIYEITFSSVFYFPDSVKRELGCTLHLNGSLLMLLYAEGIVTGARFQSPSKTTIVELNAGDTLFAEVTTLTNLAVVRSDNNHTTLSIKKIGA